MSAAPVAPYYQDDYVTLYHGDAEELLQPMLHGIERIIADPPYGTSAYPTDNAPTLPVIRQWIASSATAAFFGYPETLALWCSRFGIYPNEWVTWWPKNKPPVHFSRLLPRETECVAVFGEIVAADKLTRPRSVDATNRRIAASRGLDPETARLGDVWTDAAPGVAFNHHLRQHPNEKPLSLMLKLVTMCSTQRDVVVDPFCGSGTTLVAAKQLGRKAIGIEIDQAFCRIAAARCAQDVLDLEDVS